MAARHASASHAATGKSSAGALQQHTWAVDFTESHALIAKDVPDPLGYLRQAVDGEEASGKAIKVKEAEVEMKQAKAWETATGPVKNILMIAFMLWMAGSTVQIFSIGILVSALWQPISGIRAISSAFEAFRDPRVDTATPKLIFFLVNMAGLGIGLAKLNALGLLPTHASDWVSSLPPRQVLEFSGGGAPLT